MILKEQKFLLFFCLKSFNKLIKISNEINVQECDATDDAIRSLVRLQKNFFTILLTGYSRCLKNKCKM